MTRPAKKSQRQGKRPGWQRLLASRWARLAAVAVLLAILVSVLILSLGRAPTLSQKVSRIAKPYQFNTLGWELGNLNYFSPFRNRMPATPDDVLRYFSLTGQIDSLQTQIQAAKAGKDSGDFSELTSRLNEAQSEKTSLEPGVEAALTRQINETLASEGIYSSFLKVKLNLPPVSFRLTVPPHNLAVSPRDRIFLQQTILLDQAMQTPQMESIESRVDALGVSSVVLDLGGFGGAYPTFVDNSSDMRFTVETAIHEWLHLYLGFKPLGFHYLLELLGIRHDGDIATMNETVADIVSKELASQVLCKYYSQCGTGQTQPPPGAFNFDQEMKNTRKAVDAYLARGDVSGAEEFMEQERLFLLTKGYYIRKLNQAYFAFNDQYADTPASTNPIGGELAQFRSQSPSLRAFLEQVSRMTSRQELTASIK